MNCSVPICDLPIKTSGLCNAHYMRKWKTGSPGTSPVKSIHRRGDSTSDRLSSRLVAVATGCVEWQGARNANGYGVIGWSEGGKRRTWLTHRLAWKLAYGDPGESVVMHSCDNPACCNVDHLSLGTQGDNMADCISKGRHPKVGT